MSEYYTAKRSKNLYELGSPVPFKLSRSKIELYMQCPKCFYLDRRLGVSRPPSPPYTLNSAVDTLLKKEFDMYREKGEAHPLMKRYGIDAVPARHAMLGEWRNNFKGVQYLHEPTNLLLFGAIDDIWQDRAGRYIVVDYKSTSKNEEIKSLDKDWQDAYKRQMEMYQWLLRKNGLDVFSTGYFVYCNGNTAADRFDARIEFNITLIPYEGRDGWVDEVVSRIYGCLNSEVVPPDGDSCDFCAYRRAALELS